MRDEGDFNMQQLDDEIDIAMNEAFDNAAMDSGNLVKLDNNFPIFRPTITITNSLLHKFKSCN